MGYQNARNGFQPTPEQRRAIEHVRGPMLVVAGAGTGKTTVLTRRIAHLVASGAARPDEILAVTYTRNAAAQLISRVGKLLYPRSVNAAHKLLSSGLTATTFHAYCYKLLCEAGYKFDLIDDKDLFILLRRRLGDLHLRHFIRASDPGKFLENLLEFLRRCQDELATPADYERYVGRLERGEELLPRVAKSKEQQAMSDELILGRCREIARVFRYVEELLERENLGTFGHIITRAIDRMGRDASLLEAARRRARFILIDEFQDSNVAQIRLAKLLANEEANVFGVGDPDQSIYQFRGASGEAFESFLRIFGTQRVERVTLSENRRSTPAILKTAFQAIRCNPEVGSDESNGLIWKREALACARLDTEPDLIFAPAVSSIVYRTDEQQAAYIADAIEAVRKHRRGARWCDFAVLYRSHFHRDGLLAELRRREIPARVKGVDLLDTTQVRDALAVLRVLDSSLPVPLFRVASFSQFTIDPVRLRSELALARSEESVNLESVLERVPGGGEVLATVREARRLLEGAKSTVAAALAIARASFHLSDSEPLDGLVAFAETWSRKPRQISGNGTLREFLEYLDYFQQARGRLCVDDTLGEAAALGPADLEENEADAVQLMTVHTAKGLEFPYVFVMRIATGSFPESYRESLVEFPAALRSESSIGATAPKQMHDEEERRLFYVAITRAKEELYLLGKFNSRGKDPVPTKYLRELTAVQKKALTGALECRVLAEPTRMPTLHAASAEVLPPIAEWVQLPARADARLNELSASAIEQYDRCPLVFKLSRDWQVPEKPAAQLLFGAAMHLALKAYFDGVRVGRVPSEEDVIACFESEFSSKNIEDEVQRRLYEQQGPEQLRRLIREHIAHPKGEIIWNEKWFKFEVNGAVVKGRIDRLDRLDGDEVAVIDYKTGRAKSQEDADESLQLSIYALAAEHFGFRPGKFAFVNIEEGSVIESQRTPEELNDAREKIIEVAANIGAGNFEPKPSMFCFRCSYRTLCPAREVTLFTAPAGDANCTTRSAGMPA